MDLEYQQEQDHWERVKDEPGLQEFSLLGPAAPLGILSPLLKAGASKLLAPLQNLLPTGSGGNTVSAYVCAIFV